mmetsp:Transcript_22531/g.62596  ORF Transcript_22531/g.62596 Transcript_22531/m.62596 type:complete len:526 (+) Transcript_22531:77-1654(+)
MILVLPKHRLLPVDVDVAVAVASSSRLFRRCPAMVTTSVMDHSRSSIPEGPVSFPVAFPIMTMASLIPPQLISFMGAFLLGFAVCSLSTAYFAVGVSNLRYIWQCLLAVLRTLLISLRSALVEAQDALMMKRIIGEDETTRKWQWRRAWSVLKTELQKTRQTAKDGMMVLKQETALYAGVVGAVPGLVTVQHLLDRFWPFLIAANLQTALKDNLQQVAQQTRSIRRIQLQRLTVGATAPKLQSARIFELDSEGIALDCQVDWAAARDFECRLIVSTAPLGLARIPIRVQNIEFHGTLRIILTPLLQEPPGFGAALVSFPQAPEVNVDIRVAGGDITRIPWLRGEVISAIQQSIANDLLWPKRVVIPSMPPTPNAKPFLSTKALRQLEQSDPLLLREQDVQAQRQALLQGVLLNQTQEQDLGGMEFFQETTARQKRSMAEIKQQFKVFVNRNALNSSTAIENASNSGTAVDAMGDDITVVNTVNEPQRPVEQEPPIIAVPERQRRRIWGGFVFQLLDDALEKEKVE